MSLQVWLPFVKDLYNQGINDLEPSITSTQGSITAGGKLGNCFKTTTSGNIVLNYSPNINTGSLSFGGWFKFNKAEIQTALSTKTYTSSATAATGNLLGNDSYGGVGLIWGSNNMYSSGKELTAITIFSHIRTATVNASTSSFSITFDEWVNVYFVWDYSDRTLKFYVNGSLFNTKTFANFTDAKVESLMCNRQSIYSGNGPSASIPFFTNDIRVYDHALSQKEVKEISKGLVCHYTLGDRYIAENLITNGYGELGSENWSSSSLISTTEIPTGDSNIKASFYNGNHTKEYILLNSNHSYTISGYIKSSGATSGNTYPSIYPYDRDKKFISVFNCTEGFNSAYRTTLAQPLHKGDTKIYATDLSAWTTADNYYNYCAIFGYKDSFGTVYDDMVYTQDCPTFASKGSTKTNIDKTNNIITLNSAYNGADRPAGTTICQATAGSTYYYPWGGIALSSISDWVFKTATFIPKNTNRLKACRYILWSTYGNCYIAGNKLVDNTDTDRTVYDCSGLNNHGQLWSYDTAGSIVVSSGTPRYSVSTFINSDNNTTNTASGTQYIYGNCTLKAPDRLTVAFWCKPIAGYNGGTTQGQFSLTNYAIGNTAAADYQTAPLNHRDAGFDVNSADGTIHKRLSVTFTANEWHHYAITYDGRYGRMYKDGVETASIDMGSNVALGNMCGIVLGFSKAGGVWRSNKSSYSDFRMYTTCLSADDILELYHTGASIDKAGNMYAYEFNEV